MQFCLSPLSHLHPTQLSRQASSSSDPPPTSTQTPLPLHKHCVLRTVLTFMSISSWGTIVPAQGVISNSLGKDMTVLPESVMLLSIRLSVYPLETISRAPPSAGTRRENVMGIREVLTSLKRREFTNPANKKSGFGSFFELAMSHLPLLWWWVPFLDSTLYMN